MHVIRAYVYGQGTEYSFLGNYFVYGEIDSNANKVTSCELTTSAETTIKKVRKAFQYMI